MRVLVTGTGSGIGEAVARRLARAGHRVIGTVRDAGRAEALSAEARQAGLPLEFKPLDLVSAESIDELAQWLLAGGGVDALVNNAGCGVFGPIEVVEAAEVQRQFAANLLGPIELTRRLLPVLRERRGRIVWIGSLAGRQSLPFQAHYSATKAAMAAISDALRMELAPLGVAVTCVEPGDVATGFTAARRVCRTSDPAYAARLEASLRAVEAEERGGVAPEVVARAVERVLASRRPPSRVAVGRFAGVACVFLRLAPHSLAQWVVRRIYGA